MAGDLDFPTTDRYKLGVDIDLGAPSLRQHFTAAMSGVRISDLTREMLRRITRKSDVGILLEEDRPANLSSYRFAIDTITVNLGGDDFFVMFKNNEPPIIPKEFTDELNRHLQALHEAEHRTQYTIIKNPETGKVDLFASYPNLKTNLLNTDKVKELAESIIVEADADLAVLKHLEEMDLPHVGLFWTDWRSVSALTAKLTFEQKSLRDDHDNVAIVEYFQKTGKVLDPVYVQIQKEGLLKQVRAEVLGKPYELASSDSLFLDINAVTKNYGLDFLDFATVAATIQKFDEQTVQDIFAVRPQIAMTAMQRVLQRGNLTEFQKMEAERFMDAALRLGYTPEDRNHIDQVRDVLESKLGLKRVDADAPQPPAALNNKGFKDAPV